MRLWSAQTLSAFGARISREGLGLAAILALNASPMQMGVLAALSVGPAFVVGLFAGGHVDRHSRRRLMIGADLVRALLLFTVPLAALAGALSMPQLYAVAALVGGAGVLFEIADHAYLPSLIASEHLVEGNARQEATDAVAEVAGPALTGVLVQWLTAPLAIAVNAATYLASALILARIGHREPPPVAAAIDAPWWQGFGAGLAALLAHPLVRPLLLMRLTAMLFGCFFAALYTVYAIKALGLSSAMLGLTIAAGGAGGLLGALLLPWLLARLPAGPVLLGCALMAGSFNLLIPLAHGTPLQCMLLLMAAQFGGDAMAVAASIAGDSLRQSILPPEMLGRCAAAFEACQGMAGLLGALAGGMLTTRLGLHATVAIAAIGLAVAPLWGIASPLRRLRTLGA